MVGIVETDADEFAHIGDTGADAAASVQPGQGAEVGGADFFEARLRESGPANVIDKAGEIADGAIVGQNGGLFGALGADTQQFHQSGPCKAARSGGPAGSREAR